MLDGFDSVLFSNGEWKIIKTYFAEEDFPAPDIQYASRGKGLKAKGCGSMMFDSEVGQDHYCILYAYFLRGKDRGEKLKTQRQTLILLYRELNSIFQRLRGGGTYFGHTDRRIAAYAEYSTSNFSEYMKDGRKEFDISTQRNLYVKSLKQIIEDEIEHDHNGIYANDSERKEAKRVLMAKADHINSLITDYFYLKNVRDFQYSMYNY